LVVHGRERLVHRLKDNPFLSPEIQHEVVIPNSGRVQAKIIVRGTPNMKRKTADGLGAARLRT
jgi:hypothetical protein